jgi:hypothetical protein
MSDTDSPDHIATVRRIVTEREPFPTDAFFIDAGAHGADPRKGLYHPWVALVVRATHVDPVETWRLLPFFFIPLFAFAMYSLTFALTESRMAGVIAAFLLPLLYGGGPGGTELRETVYSTRVGEIVALLAAAALVRYVEGGGRRRLVLFAATATAAIAIHVWYVLYFAIAFGAWGAATLLARRFERRLVTRLALAAAGMLALAGPYLLFRAGQAYAPVNVIHTEPQGLLYLSSQLFLVDPRAVWFWNGAFLLVALAAVPWFWSKRALSTGAIYLAAVTPVVLLLVLDPLLLPLLHARLGYLTMRLIWIAPVIPAVATVMAELGRVAVRRRGRPGLLAAGGLLVIALLLAPHVREASTLITQRGQLRAAEAERGPAAWMDLLAFLRDRYPGPRVLLSDPATNYSIPAYTGHYVSAYLDQHSSPNDPRGLERILDARDVLSPYVGMARTLRILRAYRVDAVVLNQRFTHPIQFDYWSMTPALYAPMREKFESHPGYFRLVWSAPGAWVYELTAAARTGPLPPPGDPPRPFVLAHDPGLVPRPVPDGGFLQHGTVVTPARVAAGDTLDLVTYWSVAGAEAPAAGSYLVYVRLDAEPPRGPLEAAAWGKPYRKLQERLAGVKWRLRETHVPLGGMFGPDEWRPGEIVEDRYRFPVVSNAAPGDYEVRVRMVRSPHYPNLHLRDYLRDDDLWSGPVVAHVTIEAAGQAAPAARSGP